MGVDADRGLQFARRARELAENQHAGQVDAAGDVFLSDEVHPVPQRRHQHDVGGEIQGDELLQWEAAMQVVDGGMAHRRVFAVDLSDQAFDLVTFVLVVADLFATRDRDLHEDVAGAHE